MKIWYQSMAPVARLPNYRKSLAAKALVASDGRIEAFVNGVREERYKGRLPADVHKYPYAKLVLQLDAIEFGMQAEKEGHAAYVIGSFSEPFLTETRSVLGIPVVSLAEAALLAACALGERFALVTLSAEYARRLRLVVRRHGLESRLTNVYATSRPMDEGDVERAFAAPAALIDDVTTIARRATGEGADVIIPAEGLLSEVLAQNRVTTIDQATIIDCVGAAVLHADFLIQAQRRLGMHVGRRWGYAKPPADLLADLRPQSREEME